MGRAILVAKVDLPGQIWVTKNSTSRPLLDSDQDFLLQDKNVEVFVDFDLFSKTKSLKFGLKIIIIGERACSSKNLIREKFGKT